jgi:hypothetical protein
MNYLKKLYIPVIGAVLSGVAFNLANSARTFGELVNSSFPCVQDPITSFPCYGWVDLGVAIVAVALFIVCTILIVFRLAKLTKSR